MESHHLCDRKPDVTNSYSSQLLDQFILPADFLKMEITPRQNDLCNAENISFGVDYLSWKQENTNLGDCFSIQKYKYPWLSESILDVRNIMYFHNKKVLFFLIKADEWRNKHHQNV